jgi:protein TonB
MSNSKKTHGLIRQNEQIVKKSQKHDANLQKNSTLYFQVGLIVCLVAVFGLLEMKFETSIPNYGDYKPLDDLDYVNIPIIQPVKPTFEEPAKRKKVIHSEKFTEAPNDSELENLVEQFIDPIINTPNINPDFEGLIDEPIDEEPVAFINVEVVPIYPGCENKKTNNDKRKCMSEKITKLVQTKFDVELASELGLSGKQTIQTQFKIDKTGRVIDIKTRGTHPELEKEAQRVINNIPEMIPGKQRDKNVGVIYSLPIVFQVQN